MDFHHKAGISKSRLSAGESNILGWGKDLKFSYIKETDATEKRLIYFDNNLTHHIQMKIQYISTDEGPFRALSFEKPFWQLKEQTCVWIIFHSK